MSRKETGTGQCLPLFCTILALRRWHHVDTLVGNINDEVTFLKLGGTLDAGDT